MQDLEEAVDYSCQAIQLRVPGHPDRSMFLNDLAIALITRFLQTGIMQDLDEAIKSLSARAAPSRPRD